MYEWREGSRILSLRCWNRQERRCVVQSLSSAVERRGNLHCAATGLECGMMETTCDTVANTKTLFVKDNVDGRF